MEAVSLVVASVSECVGWSMGLHGFLGSSSMSGRKQRMNEGAFTDCRAGQSAKLCQAPLQSKQTRHYCFQSLSVVFFLMKCSFFHQNAKAKYSVTHKKYKIEQRFSNCRVVHHLRNVFKMQTSGLNPQSLIHKFSGGLKSVHLQQIPQAGVGAVFLG